MRAVEVSVRIFPAYPLPRLSRLFCAVHGLRASAGISHIPFLKVHTPSARSEKSFDDVSQSELASSRPRCELFSELDALIQTFRMFR